MLTGSKFVAIRTPKLERKLPPLCIQEWISDMGIDSPTFDP